MSPITNTLRTHLQTVALVASLPLLLAHCATEDTGAESETHFLSACSGSCDDGLSCLCGVCTRPCASDDMCSELSGAARCLGAEASCGAAAGSACAVTCAADADCAALGDSLACETGRCRPTAVAPGVDAGQGTGGAGGASGAGGVGTGGAGGDGGMATGGSGGAGGVSGSAGTGGTGAKCDAHGDTCCDPFPGDGPNYCEGGLLCEGNQCVDCNCVLGGFSPVCGSDGVTYDAICGRSCVPVTIACDGMCPCPCLNLAQEGCAAGGTPCCGALQCCQGVPYAATGECQSACNMVSDRALKTDIQPVDTSALLESVARLPIRSWRYRSEQGAQHVGPMAQDFAAELGLGDDDRVIATVDASGVALGAIQALHREVRRLADENLELRHAMGSLEAKVARGCAPDASGDRLRVRRGAE